MKYQGHEVSHIFHTIIYIIHTISNFLVIFLGYFLSFISLINMDKQYYYIFKWKKKILEIEKSVKYRGYEIPHILHTFD